MSTRTRSLPLSRPSACRFLVDVCDHHACHFIWIGGKPPFPQTLFFQSLKEVLVELGFFNDGKGHAKNRKHAGCHKVLTDADGLFTHPLRCGTRSRQIGNAVPETAYTYHFRSGNQNSAVVHAGADSQTGRHSHGFTDLPEPGTGQIGGFRGV